MAMATEVTDLGVCEACGMDTASMHAALAARDEVIATLREDLANVEGDLRGKRAQMKRLKADQDKALRSDPLFPVAMNVLEFWKRECSPGARELGGKRLENCLARCYGRKKAGLSEEQIEAELKRAVEGYALKPYTVGPGRRSHEGQKDDWHADAELIFRSDRHVQNGIRIAERADELRQVLDPQAPATVEETAASPLGQAALRMARFGFRVFPVIERDKRPATRHGLNDATRDERRIVRAWSARPHLNVGVKTGQESGIVVLDVDGDDGWDSLMALQDQHEDLPDTLSVTTPRGGQHFYFVHPGYPVRNSAGLLGYGLDVRGDGGYVLAPPSVGPNGSEYVVDEQVAPAPMPKWLQKVIVDKQLTVERALEDGNLAKFMRDGATKGNRNDRLFTVAWTLLSKHNVEPANAATIVRSLNATECAPPLPGKDVEKIVQSALTRLTRKAAA
jgi:hypothetical protein